MIRWGALLLGATAGLLAMTVLSLLGAVVVRIVDGGEVGLWVAISIALFSAQFLAGVVAGRFAPTNKGFHGSLGALLFYGVSSAFLIVDGSRPGAITIAMFAVLAMVLGGAGGVLAAARTR